MNMIAKLRGRVDSKGADWIVIDVGGVGYLAECSARTLSRLPAPGEAAEILTRMLVSESAIRLVGFAEEAEREWFDVLAAVSGVGPKLALSLLSALAPNELSMALASGDVAMLTRANGVGPKLARRLVAELKDRALTIGAGTLELPKEAVAGVAAATTSQNAVDAVSALVNLGYGQAQASAAVAAAMKQAGEDAQTGELIRLALRRLAE